MLAKKIIILACAIVLVTVVAYKIQNKYLYLALQGEWVGVECSTVLVFENWSYTLGVESGSFAITGRSIIFNNENVYHIGIKHGRNLLQKGDVFYLRMHDR